MASENIVQIGPDGQVRRDERTGSPLYSIPGHNSPIARWRVRVSEGGEANITPFIEPKQGARSETVKAVLRWVGAFKDATGEPDREANNERASRRARGEMRRTCVHNMLRYMWVLTFAESVRDHQEAMRAVALFAKRLRYHLGVEVYMYAPEPHPGVRVWAPGYPAMYVGGHGWHVNFFVNERLDHAAVERIWEHGYVWVKDWGKERRFGPLRERVRAAAAYGAKYAGKDQAELVKYNVHRTQRAHRYEIAQGSRPRWSVARAATIDAALLYIARQGRVLRQFDLDGGGMWVRFSPRVSSDPP